MSKKDTEEEGENTHITNFGGIRLDSMNEGSVNINAMTVGKLTNDTTEHESMQG